MSRSGFSLLRGTREPEMASPIHQACLWNSRRTTSPVPGFAICASRRSARRQFVIQDASFARTRLAARCKTILVTTTVPTHSNIAIFAGAVSKYPKKYADIPPTIATIIKPAPTLFMYMANSFIRSTATPLGDLVPLLPYCCRSRKAWVSSFRSSVACAFTAISALKLSATLAINSSRSTLFLDDSRASIED